MPQHDSNPNRRSFKPLRFALQDRLVDDPEALDKLLQLFYNYDVLQEKAVAKQRLAFEAQAEAQVVTLEAEKTRIQFLREAAPMFPEVARQQFWFVYRKEDKIYLECPFTERIQRNITRQQLSALDHQVRMANDDQSNRADNDLFEENDGQEEGGDQK